MRNSRSLSHVLVLLGVLMAGQRLFAIGPRSERVRYDGADWHVKGEGVVCCPCAVPCPCRTNSPPTYGHCEATLYVSIAGGHYGKIPLSGVRLCDVSGSCSMTFQNLSTLYFDEGVTREQQIAIMKLLTSFFPNGAASFPYVRSVPMKVHVVGGSLFTILIPHILEMVVDRNWGQPSAPFPWVAADDHFSNVLQYAQNLRYRLHDPGAKLDFDYSHRQANYRKFDVDIQQYRSKSMLIQFQDKSGWFNKAQLRLIREQRLRLPELETLQAEALRWKQAARGNTR